MITNISLKNVRKFEKLNLNINSKNVLLFGSNAVGKTTILEAISLASITKSHRTNSLKEIIKEYIAPLLKIEEIESDNLPTL